MDVFSQENASGRREAAVPRSVGEVRGPPQEVPSTVGGQVDQLEENIGEKNIDRQESKLRTFTDFSNGILFIFCVHVFHFLRVIYFLERCVWRNRRTGRRKGCGEFGGKG